MVSLPTSFSGLQNIRRKNAVERMKLKIKVNIYSSIRSITLILTLTSLRSNRCSFYFVYFYSYWGFFSNSMTVNIYRKVKEGAFFFLFLLENEKEEWKIICFFVCFFVYLVLFCGVFWVLDFFNKKVVLNLPFVCLNHLMYNLSL